MKIIKNFHFIWISLVLFISCSDDFINLQPENYLNTEEFYTTQDDFNSAVMASYAKLQSQVNLYFELVEWRSDNLVLTAPTSGTQDRYNINQFNETSANGLILDAWANFYNGIFRSNTIIAQISQADFDETLKNQFEAEARFIRAMNYFNIVRLWGAAPIVLKPVTAEQALNIGRSHATEVYSIIEDDLTYAIANLPTQYPTDNFGRATKGAASTLMGKVYLSQGKADKAVETLRPIIGSYVLMDEIGDVFDPENKTNGEIIFSIRFNKEIQSEGHGLWFGITDLSVSPFTEKLTHSYESEDARLNMISYQQVGNRFAPRKFADSQSGSTNEYGNDYILLRYADVLLMMAEALNQEGYQSSGQAFDFLNEVRVRARLTPLDATDLPNQESFKNAVFNERFLEFPLEGHRWFDLIRSGFATQELNEVNISIEPHQLLYPVPQVEIEKINNREIFDQNEGY